MQNVLTYDLMLEPAGILAPRTRTELKRDLEPGETISVHGRRWLVTDVMTSRARGSNRRAIAREVIDESDL